jgi:hypothetical protein
MQATAKTDSGDPSASSGPSGLRRRIKMQNSNHDLRDVSAQRAAERFRKWAKDEHQPSTYENHYTTVNQFVA